MTKFLAPRRRALAAAATLLALSATATSVSAQACPDEPIRIIVGFAPGG